MERKIAWNEYSEEQLQQLEGFCGGYKDFLTKCKTERECVSESIRMAEEKGFRNLADVIAAGESLQPGDKVYAQYMKKSLLLFHIGTDPLEKGMAILGAHIDSPRIDVKQNPLYEEGGMAYLDTHYYGGVKKYQWVTIPLALHGVIAKKDGSLVQVCLGEKAEEPVLVITDLLPHLAQEQMEKNAKKVVEGEKLDVIVGSLPLADEEKDAVRGKVLEILKEKYDMEEEDFLSAELELVPAGPARDAGLDSSMILAYGQDDRVCAYTSLLAMLELDAPRQTACCFLCDKEEIGSVGATGARSLFLENTVAELLDRCGCGSPLSLRRCLANSRMLSSDVSPAFDPLYASAFEKKNAGYLGRGLCFNKFTGSGGKSGANDANAEYIAELRRILDEAGVCYHTCELGRVDLGGGGTIAYVMALYGMQVIDSGVPLLSMHAPWELSSKADVFEAYRGYKAFLLG